MGTLRKKKRTEKKNRNGEYNLRREKRKVKKTAKNENGGYHLRRRKKD